MVTLAGAAIAFTRLRGEETTGAVASLASTAVITASPALTPGKNRQEYVNAESRFSVVLPNGWTGSRLTEKESPYRVTAFKPSPYTDDQPTIIVSKYPSVSAAAAFQKLSGTDFNSFLAAYVRDRRGAKIGPAKLGSYDAVAVTDDGVLSFYNLYLEREGALYQIEFNHEAGSGFTVAEKELLASFTIR